MIKNILQRVPWQIKLVVLMLAMAIIPGLIISYSVTDIIRSELKYNINEQLHYSSNAIASNINSKLNKNIEILELTKNVIENQNLGAQEKIAYMISGVEKVNNLLLLSLLVLNNQKIEEALSSQKDFVLINNSQRKIPKNFKSRILEEIELEKADSLFISKPFFNKDLGTWLVAVIIKTHFAFVPNTYLLAVYDLSDIALEIENNTLNKIGNVFVSDTTGEKFLSSKFNTDIPQAIADDASALLKSESRMTLVNNYSDIKYGNYVACFSHVQNTEWIVVSYIKEAAAYATIDETFLFFALFIGLSIILSIVSALLFSKHMSNPIIKMADVSTQIAGGNFDARAEYNAKDSIGLLNGSLEKMGVQLKRNFKEIEQQKAELEDYSKNLEVKVEQRTNELSESNKELKKAYRRVLELNQEKNEFLGIAAHDLKNPLTAISAFADILKTDKELPQEQFDDFLDEIMKASSRMFSIVKNLLDVNAIEQGKLNTKMESVSIRSLNEELISQFKEATSKKGIEIIKQYDSEIDNILADYNLSFQVIQNILSNAIKFSPANKKIFMLLRESSQPESADIIIKDEGPGFTEADKQKIFQKFARLSARPTGGEHSTGLGLSIVKKLVEMMNGKIRLESEAGKGAEFIITFPKVTD